MGGISLDTAVLIAMVVEAMLYGVFLVMFFFSLWVFVYRGTLSVFNRLLVTSVLLFTVATIHFSVDAYRILAAFIANRDTPGGPLAYINALASPSYLLKSTAYTIQTLVGDACMIYRCYIIWQRKIWIIAIPCLLLLSCAATGVGVIVSFSEVGPTTQVYVFKNWVASFFAITLATNILSTGLITYRIWSVDHAAGKFRRTKSSLKPVIGVVVESGAIYSLSLVALLCVYLSNSWAHFIVLDALTPIIGIVFSMIIVRIGLSMAWGAESNTLPSSIRRNAPVVSTFMMQPQVVHVNPRNDDGEDSDVGFTPKSHADNNWKLEGLSDKGNYDSHAL